MRLATAVLLWLPRAMSVEVPADPRVRSLRMPRHSMPRESISSPNKAWKFYGAAVATSKSIVLSPAVVNRTGALWNQEPVETANFEIEYSFRINGPPQKTVTEGFAFWYSFDPVVEIPEDLSKWSLFGYLPAFRGLGVFVSNYDRSNRLNPSISAAIGDGKRVWDIHTQVPSNDGVYFPSRNSKQEITMKVAVGPGGIVGQARIGQQPYTDCFRLAFNPSTFKPGGYIGFSGRSGIKSPAGDTIEADLISVVSIQMSNLDLSQPGENPEEVAPGGQSDLDSADILKELGPHHDERALSEHLRQMNRFLYKLTVETKERDAAMQASLEALKGQVLILQNEVRAVQRGGGDGNPTSMNKVTSELAGFKSLLHNQKQQQAAIQDTMSSISQRLEQGGEGGDHLRVLADRSASLEEAVKQQATLSSWMIMAVLLAITLFGLWFWKRIRDMEKKHYL